MVVDNWLMAGFIMIINNHLVNDMIDAADIGWQWLAGETVATIIIIR